MRGRDLLAALAGAAVCMVLAGSVAWAAISDAAGVINGCYKKQNGQLRLADTGADCNPSELAISWSQQGPQGIQGPQGLPGANGTAGVSPTVAAVAAGDPNCPAGGAAITDAAGSTAYVCSGQNGQNGADGDPFTGSFTSPNGEYSISVTNAGITIAHGALNSITLTGDDLTVRSDDIDLRSDRTTTLRAGTTATVDAAGNLSLTANGTGLLRAIGTLTLQGSSINMN